MCCYCMLNLQPHYSEEVMHCLFSSFCRLSSCVITDEVCAHLALALQTNPSHLKTLDLSYNPLGDGGVMCLSAALKEPHCMLQKLR